jgi:hypothetical protein
VDFLDKKSHVINSAATAHDEADAAIWGGFLGPIPVCGSARLASCSFSGSS